MSVFLHLRDKVFRVKDQGGIPVPLDSDLLFLAENAKQSNIIQELYRTQMERNRSRVGFGDDEWEEAEHPRNRSGEFTRGQGERARKGGEVAQSNEYFYKGGQFLPSTSAPPGTYKIKGKVIGKGREFIEPGYFTGGKGKWETAPTPLHRAIWTFIGNYVQPSGEGREYLDVPYSKRAEAKAKGAQFDWDKKKWYMEKQGKQGEIELRPEAKDGIGDRVTRETTERPGVKGHMSTETYTVGDLIDRFNKGERWFEVKLPADVKVLMGRPTHDDAEFREDEHPRDEDGKFTAGHRAGSARQQEVPPVLEPLPEPSPEPKAESTEPPKGLPKSLTTELENQGYRFDHSQDLDTDMGRHVYKGKYGNTIEYGSSQFPGQEGRYWQHTDSYNERRYSGYGNLSLIGHLRRYEKGEVFDSKFAKQFGDKLFSTEMGFKPFVESDTAVAFRNRHGDEVFIYKDYDKGTLANASWRYLIDHGDGDKRSYNEGRGWDELKNTLDTVEDAHAEHKASVARVQAQIHQEIQDASQVILKKAHIPPNLFKIVDTDYEFMLNGEKHYAAGTHDSQTGMITLYSKRLPISQVRGVLSHEVMHYKFQHALDEFNEELDEIMHDERNGSDSVIKPDGSVLEQYASDYPVYSVMNELMSNKQYDLQSTDGVTAYSREWWKEYLDGKAPLRNAIHETLAEIARLDETDESLSEVKKPWMDLYRKVNQLYRTQKSRKNEKWDHRRERIQWQSQEKVTTIPDPLQRPASPSRSAAETESNKPSVPHPAVTRLAHSLMEVLNLGDRAVFKKEEHPTAPKGAAGGTGGQFVSKEEAGGAGSEPNAQTETKSISKQEHTKEPTLGKQNKLLKGAAKNSHPATISTRRPTHVNAVEGDEYRRVDLAAMKLDPENFEHDVGLFKNAEQYPNFKPGELKGTPDQQARAIINHMKNNLRFLYEAAPEKIRTEGHKWYEGAHRLAQEDADKYKLPLQSVVGAYAALSPQNLWDMNVHQAKVVLDTYFTKQQEPWDDKMTKTGEKIWLPDPKKLATTPQAAKNAAQKEALYKLIKGKTLAEMDTPVKKAMWIRTYDQAHNARSFKALSPDGRVIGTYLTDKGKPATNAWHTTGSIANAIISLESGGDRDKISPAMGNQHKVRSFYNNILDPDSDNDDVTMDTHAVGAALLSPMGQSHTAVMHSLGSKPATAAIARQLHYVAPTGNSLTGMSGTYPLFAEANRELAKELEIKPRVLQSITWEAKRRLFDRHLTKEAAQAIYTAWRDYHSGNASLEDTQKKIVRIAGGFSKGQAEADDGNNKRVTNQDAGRRRSTGDSRKLHTPELGFRTARTVDERGRGSVTGGVTARARRVWQNARLAVFLH
jgi:hypothetical protein